MEFRSRHKLGRRVLSSVSSFHPTDQLTINKQKLLYNYFLPRAT